VRPAPSLCRRGLTAAALVFFVLASPARAGDARLAGTWLKDGAAFAELKADGTGRVDHDVVAWKADGKTLTLAHAEGEVERITYSLSGGTLKVTMDDETMTLTRAGGAAKADKAAATAPTASPEGKKAVPAPQAAAPGGGKLAELLLSSPWCHFRYNKISGASGQERVVFRRDGTWTRGARTESYSSGPNGSVAGQTDSGDGGRWKAQGDRLLLSEGGAPLEDAGLEVTRNSNGYPILKSGGKEYSQCH